MLNSITINPGLFISTNISHVLAGCQSLHMVLEHVDLTHDDEMTMTLWQWHDNIWTAMMAWRQRRGDDSMTTTTWWHRNDYYNMTPLEWSWLCYDDNGTKILEQWRWYDNGRSMTEWWQCNVDNGMKTTNTATKRWRYWTDDGCDDVLKRAWRQSNDKPGKKTTASQRYAHACMTTQSRRWNEGVTMLEWRWRYNRRHDDRVTIHNYEVLHAGTTIWLCMKHTVVGDFEYGPPGVL